MIRRQHACAGQRKECNFQCLSPLLSHPALATVSHRMESHTRFPRANRQDYICMRRSIREPHSTAKPIGSDRAGRAGSARRTIVTARAFGLRIASAGLCLAALLSLPTIAQTKMTAPNAHPLHVAIVEVEERYHVPISYEEPLVLQRSRLVDIDAPPGAPDGRKPVSQLRKLKEWSIRFEVQERPSSSSPIEDTDRLHAENLRAVSSALDSILQGYATSGGAESFDVTEDGGMFHVIPRTYATEDGSTRRYVPLLDTVISIPPKRRSRAEMLNEICSAISRSTGIRLVPGLFPFKGMLADEPTEIAASNVPARVLLKQFVDEMSAPMWRDVPVRDPDGRRFSKRERVWEGAPLSWKLLYAPSFGYALNLTMIGPRE